MLTLSEIFKAQAKYGISVDFSDTETTTYEVYLAGCRRMLTDRTPIEYYSWDMKRQNDFTDNLIVDYVKNNVKNVDGFIDENKIHDIYENSGWRIQAHSVIKNHYRILNPDNIRRGWVMDPQKLYTALLEYAHEKSRKQR